jgi:phage-related protein
MQATPFNDAVNFNISGIMRAASAASLRTAQDELNAVIAAGEQELKVHDDRYMICLVEGLSWEQLKIPGYRAAEFTMDLAGKSGLWLSTALNSDSSITTAGSASITNAGNIKAPPVITITAPGGGLTAAEVSNDTSGDSLVWSGSLGASEELEIDMEEMTITEAGVESYDGFGAGSLFWELAAGANTISVTSTPAGALVVIEWRDRWL